MKGMKGYYHDPTVNGDKIVFVAEDDLWSVSIEGGIAIRLTANLGEVSSPCFSPDGKLIAFIGREEGYGEVYVMPAAGGQATRLTYLGARTIIAGWKEGKIVFASNSAQPFRSDYFLYEIDPEGGYPTKLPYGNALNVSFGKKGTVIGRKTSDFATWKRYRGGTAGELWIDKAGRGKFSRLVELKGNFANPMWIDDRIFFLSDYEGMGNLYSVDTNGKGLKRHSEMKEYYARKASTDGNSIVYQAGADIYIYDLKNETNRLVEIVYNSPYIQRNRKFVNPGKYLQHLSLDKKASRIAAITRGKLYNMGLWEGPVVQLGKTDGVRYRCANWLNDGKRIVTVSDEGGEEHLEIYDVANHKLLKKIESAEFGRIMFLTVSPAEKGDKLLCANHRNELYCLDLSTGKQDLIARNAKSLMDSASWSSDGKWIAYSNNISDAISVIFVYSVEKKESYQISKPVMKDYFPVFSDDGKYIYLISYRVLNPVYDSLHFDLGFPKGSLPYSITLQKEIKSPFDKEPADYLADKKDEEKKSKAKAKEKETIKIDLEGIEERMTAFPVSEGIYYDIQTAGQRVFYLITEIEGAITDDDWMSNESKATLKYYDLDKGKEETLMKNVQGFELSRDKSAMFIAVKNKIRVIAANSDPKSLSKESGYKKETGWINPDRIRVSVDPVSEWKQMFSEAWRLQRDYFWVEDMSDIDWKKIYKRYHPLLDRIASRSEFADLVWEMQGELGTSHAYEFGGDYKQRPIYGMGKLGADFEYDKRRKAYRISHIVNSDSWDSKVVPPLKKPGLEIEEGMYLKAINGIKLDQFNSPERVLVNFSNQEVQLTVTDKSGKTRKNVSVTTVTNDTWLRYREWVEMKKEYVHKQSKGKVGYIHIPDMMAVGYAEFHRHFLTEYDYDGIIVDVRYNGGGHVSQLLLEKLARKRIGYDLTRWFDYSPYPEYSLKGPVVALTNEYAGSDGDIFSHSFKLMKLGKLVGKRTWGGVIGIWPRNSLVDGGLTTQPEMSFWFKDVGWGVENYGTDPDIEVDMKPQDYVKGNDPQLDKALEVVLADMKKFDYVKPVFVNRPKLTLP